MVSQRDAYKEGYDTGYDIAYNNQNLTDTMSKDEFISECIETESEHYRQFSPFEFTAAEFNSSRNSEGLWDAYDDGVSKGVTKAANELYKKPKTAKPKVKGKFGYKPQCWMGVAKRRPVIKTAMRRNRR